jgi:rRNA small subunit pseudouridine methyltransferase Nep1
LGSPLNKSNNLKLYIHTLNNKIFEINPQIKIARNYNRFKGLMAKLLRENEIRIKELLLISQFNGNLMDLVKSFKKKEIVIFSSRGELIKYHLDLFDKDSTKNYIAIIGGFQKGYFGEEILNLSDRIVSISNYSLDAWIIVNKIVSFYEITNDII